MGKVQKKNDYITINQTDRNLIYYDIHGIYLSKNEADEDRGQ